MSSKSRAKPQPVDNPQPAGDLTNAPIRVQLLWSSFFPLALFALISVLAITNVFYRFSLDLVTQRNTTQAQMVAAHVEESLAAGADPQTLDLQAVLRSSGITNIHTVYIINPQGVILNRFAEGPVQNLISFEGFAQSSLGSLPTSRLNRLPRPITGPSIPGRLPRKGSVSAGPRTRQSSPPNCPFPKTGP